MENLSEQKLKLLNLIEDLVKNISSENVEGLLENARIFGWTGNNSWSIVPSFIKDIIVRDVKDYLIKNKRKTLKVKRTGEYRIETCDVYTIRDGELFRNGHHIQYTSVGKVYQAYKVIKGKSSETSENLTDDSLSGN